MLSRQQYAIFHNALQRWQCAARDLKVSRQNKSVWLDSDGAFSFNLHVLASPVSGVASPLTLGSSVRSTPTVRV